jgi:hypothetical protein
VRVTLELFATDGHLEGCLHPPHRRPIDFSGVLGLLHAIEELDLEPPPGIADPRPGLGVVSPWTCFSVEDCC